MKNTPPHQPFPAPTPAGILRNAGMGVVCFLFNLLQRAKIRRLLAQLNALLEAFHNGTLPPLPLPRLPLPHAANPAQAPRPHALAAPRAQRPHSVRRAAIRPAPARRTKPSQSPLPQPDTRPRQIPKSQPESHH